MEIDMTRCAHAKQTGGPHNQCPPLRLVFPSGWLRTMGSRRVLLSPPPVDRQHAGSSLIHPVNSGCSMPTSHLLARQLVHSRPALRRCDTFASIGLCGCRVGVPSVNVTESKTVCVSQRLSESTQGGRVRGFWLQLDRPLSGWLEGNMITIACLPWGMEGVTSAYQP